MTKIMTHTYSVFLLVKILGDGRDPNFRTKTSHAYLETLSRVIISLVCVNTWAL